MTDLRIERLRLDLGDATIDADRLRRLVQRVAALLAQRVDERAPRGGTAQQYGATRVAVRVDGANAGRGDDEQLAGAIADSVAATLVGRLL